MDKRFSNSLLTLLALVMVAFGLPSCGGGDDDAPNGGNGGNNGGNSGGGTTEQVMTGTASDVTENSATVTCNFTSSVNAGSLQLGVLYSTERSAVDNRQGTFGLANHVEGNTYTVGLSSLLSNTIYYYRAYMVSGGNTYYGSVSSFTTTRDELVTTGDATDITYKSATIASRFKTGYITSFESLGIEYSDSKETLESGRGRAATTSEVTNSNVFTVSLALLDKETTYYYRAYVKTYHTIYYGVTKSFTTLKHDVDYNGHEYVDLGLPSHTLWATMNVGASKPEEIGDYYAWGETTTKTTYTEDNYKWKGLSTDELVARGVVREDNLYNQYTLTPSYDVATVKWGNAWRMPTGEEISELEKYTTIVATTQDGVEGFRFTSTVNKNSIFLPAGGFWDKNSVINGDGKTWYRATCWSTGLNQYGDEYSMGLWIDNGSSSGMKNILYGGAERYYGSNVRPVVSY